MSLMDIALRTGVPLADIESFIAGSVPKALADRLGVALLNLQEFVEQGEVSANLAHRLGTSMAGAEELGQALGKEGRVGLVLGVLLGAKLSRAAEAGR